MQSFLILNYHWLLTVHVLSVISWMAAQLYLPRLFVYHCEVEVGGEASKTLKVMEQRLLRFIMTPAMVSSLVFGILLIWAKPFFIYQGWFLIKLTAVVLLLGTHGYCAKCVRLFSTDENNKTGRFYRILNEIPTVGMIIAVVAVIGLRVYSGLS